VAGGGWNEVESPVAMNMARQTDPSMKQPQELMCYRDEVMPAFSMERSLSPTRRWGGKGLKVGRLPARGG